MKVTEILDILGNASIMLASAVAIYGINAWRREFKGKRDIELAEEVLALFYQARDAIRAIRNPLGFKGEGSTRKPEPNESPEQKSAKDRAYVMYERYEARQEIFNKLQAKQYQFMGRFGSEKVRPFHELRGIMHEIVLAAGRLGDLWAEVPSTPEESKQHLKETRQYESVIWSLGDEDVLTPRVDGIIEDIEQICRPIIMEERTIIPFFRRLWLKMSQKKGPGEGAP